MHTFAAPTCNIIYNSDLSGQTIIRQGENEVSVDLADILEFIIHQATEHGVTKPIKDLIDHDAMDLTGITIKMTEEDGKKKKIKKLKIKG